MSTKVKTPAKRAILHMRIDPALKSKLARAAREQNRSLSNLVTTILRDHVEGK